MTEAMVFLAFACLVLLIVFFVYKLAQEFGVRATDRAHIERYIKNTPPDKVRLDMQTLRSLVFMGSDSWRAWEYSGGVKLEGDYLVHGTGSDMEKLGLPVTVTEDRMNRWSLKINDPNLSPKCLANLLNAYGCLFDNPPIVVRLYAWGYIAMYERGLCDK